MPPSQELLVEVPSVVPAVVPAVVPSVASLVTDSFSSAQQTLADAAHQNSTRPSQQTMEETSRTVVNHLETGTGSIRSRLRSSSCAPSPARAQEQDDGGSYDDVPVVNPQECKYGCGKVSVSDLVCYIFVTKPILIADHKEPRGKKKSREEMRSPVPAPSR